MNIEEEMQFIVTIQVVTQNYLLLIIPQIGKCLPQRKQGSSMTQSQHFVTTICLNKVIELSMCYLTFIWGPSSI